MSLSRGLWHLLQYLVRLALSDLLLEQPCAVVHDARGVAGGSSSDSREVRAAVRPVRVQAPANAAGGFDELYMDLIGGLAKVSGGTTRGQRLERAFHDSVRECLSDPSIIALIRRSTVLGMRGADETANPL